jgi:hypothetical protein
VLVFRKPAASRRAGAAVMGRESPG